MHFQPNDIVGVGLSINRVRWVSGYMLGLTYVPQDNKYVAPLSVWECKISQATLLHRPEDKDSKQELFSFFTATWIETTQRYNTSIKDYIKNEKERIGINRSVTNDIEKLLASLSTEEIKTLLSKKKVR